MKILMQNLRSGETYLEQVPVPAVPDHHCLIRSVCSLVSPGTEKMLVQFGKSGWIDKIRQQPDKVGLLWTKIQQEGLWSTLDQVRHKLDQPIALGYSNVGRIVSIGKGVQGLKVGDRVVSNGYHAEYNCVSENLCCRIPDEVEDEDAAFVILASIALEGIRLAKVELGERVVVMGMGLLGLLTAQLLRASGCEVIGVDPSDGSRALAASMGFKVFPYQEGFSSGLFQTEFSGVGADAVIITAASKDSLLNDAAGLCRTRGRIILVGVIQNEFNRDLFYKKELSVQVACSYGPGRYDPDYEEKGQDYPIAYVRWTAKRNMQAVLQLMAAGSLQLKPLIFSRADFDEAPKQFYKDLDKLQFGNLIRYDNEPADEHQTSISLFRESTRPVKVSKSAPGIALIGSGAFVTSTLLPKLKALGAHPKTLCSSQPGALALARKFGISKVCSDPDELWSDPEIQMVMIANRHYRHGSLVLKALEAGKQVFVEKPLTIFREELDHIRRRMHPDLRLVVGYNRRFSTYVETIRKAISSMEDKLNINYVINAGFIPAQHWIQDPDKGGGRILGEVCHFVDLCNTLTRSSVTELHAVSLGNGQDAKTADNVSIQMKYQNGSIATIQYYSNGSRKAEKECLQVFFGGNIIELHNFKNLSAHGLNISSGWFPKMDKGYDRQFTEFLDPHSRMFGAEYQQQILHTSEICFQIVEQLQSAQNPKLSQ
ncbi:MAG TPA: bi-domain-containing oxidoreductase [Saprospiraceae bacterium]|nr:bi-domain-containing oxidoreductase [Saprospiraceae bacterium]